jgi:hypothetical protein
MARRADPTRIDAARREATRQRLLSTGMLPDRVDALMPHGRPKQAVAACSRADGTPTRSGGSGWSRNERVSNRGNRGRSRWVGRASRPSSSRREPQAAHSATSPICALSRHLEIPVRVLP